MEGGIVGTTDTRVYLIVTHMRYRSGPIGAYRIVIMVAVTTIPIHYRCTAAVRIPPSGPVTPIPGRGPTTTPCRSPEPIVDQGTIEIDGFDDIVLSIYIGIADNLHRYLVRRIALHDDRGNILIHILGQHSLKHHKTCISIGGLHNS